MALLCRAALSTSTRHFSTCTRHFSKQPGQWWDVDPNKLPITILLDGGCWWSTGEAMWLEKGLKKRGKEVKMIDVYDKRYYNPSKNEGLVCEIYTKLEGDKKKHNITEIYDKRIYDPAKHPGIPRQQAMLELHCITPEGSTFRGFDAALYLYKEGASIGGILDRLTSYPPAYKFLKKSWTGVYNHRWLYTDRMDIKRSLEGNQIYNHERGEMRDQIHGDKMRDMEEREEGFRTMFKHVITVFVGLAVFIQAVICFGWVYYDDD